MPEASTDTRYGSPFHPSTPGKRDLNLARRWGVIGRSEYCRCSCTACRGEGCYAYWWDHQADD